MTLKEELSALRQRLEAGRTPELVAKMHRAVDELRQSGAVDRILKVGAKAPELRFDQRRGEAGDAQGGARQGTGDRRLLPRAVVTLLQRGAGSSAESASGDPGARGEPGGDLAAASHPQPRVDRATSPHV